MLPGRHDHKRVDGDEFSGSVKIKLGPISLMYNGSGRYVERNDADRRVVIEARGKDISAGTERQPRR